MGNRATISFPGRNFGFYLHWNGGRDSVEGFLLAARTVMADRLGDESYGIARLAECIGVFFDGNLSFGIDSLDRLDRDNGDNGEYIVSAKTLTIVGRRYFQGEEQQQHDSTALARDIVERITYARQ